MLHLIEVCMDIHVMMSSDLYWTCRHCLYGVAVSDTYRDDISDRYSIWDRIYSSHSISWDSTPPLGCHTYQVTLTQLNEIDFTCTTHRIPGCTAHSVDHMQNSWAYSQQSCNHYMTELYFVLKNSWIWCDLSTCADPLSQPACTLQDKNGREGCCE